MEVSLKEGSGSESWTAKDSHSYAYGQASSLSGGNEARYCQRLNYGEAKRGCFDYALPSRFSWQPQSSLANNIVCRCTGTRWTPPPWKGHLPWNGRNWISSRRAL